MHNGSGQLDSWRLKEIFPLGVGISGHTAGALNGAERSQKEPLVTELGREREGMQERAR